MAEVWHNKHISTKWGIAILGWLLVSVVLLIPVLGRNEDIRSHASSSSLSQSANVGSICKRKRVATAKSSTGIYEATWFGCSDSAHDSGDNCLPAASNIPECAGIPKSQCEMKVKYFSANIDQYGRNALLKITNPNTGAAVIVRAIDQGPNCSVQRSHAKFDMSHAALAVIGSPQYVKVEVARSNAKLGLDSIPAYLLKKYQ